MLRQVGSRGSSDRNCCASFPLSAQTFAADRGLLCFYFRFFFLGLDFKGLFDTQREQDFGHPGRLAMAAALKDNILHFAAAQSFGALFPYDPTEGVGDIGFPAAVGTYDRRDALGIKDEFGGVTKGLETLQKNFFDSEHE
jgi:hypothetical protein